jgi:hypothetical protein
MSQTALIFGKIHIRFSTLSNNANAALVLLQHPVTCTFFKYLHECEKNFNRFNIIKVTIQFGMG